MPISRSQVVVLALALDRFIGDPPNRYHPVAWMGSLIARAERHAPAGGNLARLAYGAGIDAAGMALVASTGWLASRTLGRLPRPLAYLGEAVLLKMVIALHGLCAAATEVHAALESGDLPEARRLLSWHLVSRDTSALDTSQVAAATIESVAENNSDGVIAPLFYYALGGLPGALAYRFANTADSMLGYHDPIREWLGKVPARLDDVTNLIPARLTACLLNAAAWLHGGNAAVAYLIRRRDASQTASPNAGHPMSVMAGALGVELEKVGHYRLGAGLNVARPDDIPKAVRLMHTATLLGAGALLVTGAVFHRRAKRRT